MPANLILRKILEMSNNIDVENRETQVTAPWWLDYEVAIPKPTPYSFERIIEYTLTCYETRNGCALNNVPDKELLPVTTLINAAPKKVKIIVSEDEFNSAIAGLEGNLGTLVVTKLIAWLAGVYGANYATVKSIQIDITDPANPVVTDITP